ncbi:glycosyltransferase [Streptococcus hyovaginalis]|uniref:glycosyltransferase family 4 protein n=1 Tax=Streptococcus hyovaginalis TaxID=149015 RepID=UPI002A7CB39C|nr:glycosyltransferase [Streptococcus hyovaginalis]MDY3023827.1 glycosyltransferase [Streptococcus hyovaginalis]MDY4511587.1 glycosyltransferase [Streptococcus hyovaginalis]
MKVLLYLEAPDQLSKSGIGRAIKHQQKALEIAGIDYTMDPQDDYDIVHINTYGIKSWQLLRRSQKAGKRVIMHAHSTKEDFENSFIGSNMAAPLFKRHLMRFYQAADYLITPTDYSKRLIQSYGITTPISAISNGIDLSRYQQSDSKEAIFRAHFNLKSSDKVVISAGLFFERKGILDFVKVAKLMPEVTFIWFGYINHYLIPSHIRKIVQGDHPQNVIFPGYIKGDIYEGAMTGANAFFFPSHEETEGIVVLEALASRQNVLLRDIPVYEGWIDESSAYLARDVLGFVRALEKILSGEMSKTEAGYQVAAQKDIQVVAEALAAVYQKVMEL